MRDRRDSDTSQYSTVEGGRSDTTQRNLFIGVGGFVVAFLVIGILLLSGGDDDDGDAGALATNTRSATELAASAGGTVTAPSGAGVVPTSPGSAMTSTTGPKSETATTERVIPTVTPSDPAAPGTEDVPTDEPEATEEPADADPEATEDTDNAEPTEAPVVGDFGQLPPIQIVSGGLGRSIELEYVLDAASFAAPELAPVYEIQWKLWSADDLAMIAENLGIDGDVEDNGGDNFQLSGTEAQMFTGPTPTGPPIFQYETLAERLAEPLPDDATLVELSYSFLVDGGIIPDAGEGVVVGRDDDAGVAIVEFKPVEPSPLLAALPAASVTLGPGGVVQSADVRWPADYAESDYGLRATSALWNDVLAGEASMDADLSAVPDGATIGTFTVTDIGTAYSLAGFDYLAPLVVFYGDVYFSEVDMTVPMRIYVQAVAGQDTPAG